MEELLMDILPKLSIPGVLISLFLVVLRMRPVTLLTSNPIERKMLTKERNFLIKVIKLVFEAVITVVMLLLITESLFKDNNLFNQFIAITWVILLFVFFLLMMFFLEIKNKNFFNIFQNTRNKYKILLYITTLIFAISYYFLPAYFVGTQLYSEIYVEEFSLTGGVVILVAISILYLFLAIFVLMPISRIIFRFLDLGRTNPYVNDKPVYVELADGKWYIHYPVDKNLFYLADKPNFSSSTKFKFVSRDELLKQTLRI
ncbi:hypothetical protein ACWGNU_01940 [Paenibacillus lautus]